MTPAQKRILMTAHLTFLALLRKLPLMTALAEGLCLLGLAGFYVANGLRVELSYQPWSSARDAVLARYGFFEHVFVRMTVWPAFFVVLPLLTVQLLACLS